MGSSEGAAAGAIHQWDLYSRGQPEQGALSFAE